MATAKLRYVGPVTEVGDGKGAGSDFVVSTSMPNGKSLVFTWNRANDYTVDVPTEIRYKDDFGAEKVFSENYAQHLLDVYGKFFDLVEIVTPPPVVQEVVRVKKTKKEKDQ